MDLIQAGFDILMILSAIDGNIDDSEIDVAKEFLKNNFHGTFDPEHEIKLLQTLNSDGLNQRFQEAAAEIAQKLSLEDKMGMLDFALATILADKKVTDSENYLFRSLGEYWGFDVEAYLEDRLSNE